MHIYAKIKTKQNEQQLHVSKVFLNRNFLQAISDNFEAIFLYEYLESNTRNQSYMFL